MKKKFLLRELLTIVLLLCALCQKVNSQGYNPTAYKGFQSAIDKAVAKENEISNEYVTLREKAIAIGSLIDPNDKDAYNMYQTYMNMLDSGANDLMRNGLNYNSMSQMQNIKSLYNRYMVPLSNAYAARAAEIKSQQEAYDNDNSIRFEREATATPLSSYLRNPNLHARSVSGRAVMMQVSSMLKNYQHSFDLKTISDAIQHIDNPKYAQLKFIIDTAENIAGYKEWADEETQEYIHDWALNGLLL